MQEIERKFLVKELPDLSKLKPIIYERYFLKITPDSEVRIQAKGKKYELETKTNKSAISSKKEKKEITKDEFEKLKKKSKKSIIREGFLLSKKPETSIKVYHGDYEGLIRLEVEFKTEKEANQFIPPPWASKEITGTELGRDSSLIKLNKKQFRNILETFLYSN